MNKEDIATMKLTRKDLVKACAAQILEAQRQEILDADKAREVAQVLFNEQVVDECRERYGRDIVEITGICEGRIQSLEYRVCTDIVPGQEVPEFACVIVRDGTDYDCNVRLQFRVRLEEELWVAANDVRKAMIRCLDAQAASEKTAAMETKAREKLISDALDSTEAGKRALAALVEMRKEIAL